MTTDGTLPPMSIPKQSFLVLWRARERVAEIYVLWATLAKLLGNGASGFKIPRELFSRDNFSPVC